MAKSAESQTSKSKSSKSTGKQLSSALPDPLPQPSEPTGEFIEWGEAARIWTYWLLSEGRTQDAVEFVAGQDLKQNDFKPVDKKAIARLRALMQQTPDLALPLVRSVAGGPDGTNTTLQRFGWVTHQALKTFPAQPMVQVWQEMVPAWRQSILRSARFQFVEPPDKATEDYILGKKDSIPNQQFLKSNQIPEITGYSIDWINIMQPAREGHLRLLSAMLNNPCKRVYELIHSTQLCMLVNWDMVGTPSSEHLFLISDMRRDRPKTDYSANPDKFFVEAIADKKKPSASRSSDKTSGTPKRSTGGKKKNPTEYMVDGDIDGLRTYCKDAKNPSIDKFEITDPELAAKAAAHHHADPALRAQLTDAILENNSFGHAAYGWLACAGPLEPGTLTQSQWSKLKALQPKGWVDSPEAKYIYYRFFRWVARDPSRERLKLIADNMGRINIDIKRWAETLYKHQGYKRACDVCETNRHWGSGRNAPFSFFASHLSSIPDRFEPLASAIQQDSPYTQNLSIDEMIEQIISSPFREPYGVEINQKQAELHIRKFAGGTVPDDFYQVPKLYQKLLNEGMDYSELHENVWPHLRKGILECLQKERAIAIIEYLIKLYLYAAPDTDPEIENALFKLCASPDIRQSNDIMNGIGAMDEVRPQAWWADFLVRWMRLTQCGSYNGWKAVCRLEQMEGDIVDRIFDDLEASIKETHGNLLEGVKEWARGIRLGRIQKYLALQRYGADLYLALLESDFYDFINVGLLHEYGAKDKKRVSQFVCDQLAAKLEDPRNLTGRDFDIALGLREWMEAGGHDLLELAARGIWQTEKDGVKDCVMLLLALVEYGHYPIDEVMPHVEQVFAMDNPTLWRQTAEQLKRWIKQGKSVPLTNPEQLEEIIARDKTKFGKLLQPILDAQEVTP